LVIDRIPIKDGRRRRIPTLRGSQSDETIAGAICSVSCNADLTDAEAAQVVKMMIGVS
jgi:hypothetical protein